MELLPQFTLLMESDPVQAFYIHKSIDMPFAQAFNIFRILHIKKPTTDQWAECQGIELCKVSNTSGSIEIVFDSMNDVLMIQLNDAYKSFELNCKEPWDYSTINRILTMAIKNKIMPFMAQYFDSYVCGGKEKPQPENQLSLF
jgi:hypothetical protein